MGMTKLLVLALNSQGGLSKMGSLGSVLIPLSGGMAFGH